MELYKKYRPKTLEKVIGQNSAVLSLQKMEKTGGIPHTILFSGPSGCGKTTLARIVSRMVGCSDMDLQEKNCADFKGIDTVREIRNVMSSAPLSGKSRVWIIDEAHKLTNDAQNAFLKILEDTPKHVYFFLCTTEPQKLITTIRTRCTEISVKPLSDTDLEKIIRRVCKLEKAEISDRILEKLIEVSGGSARKALVFLNQIIGLPEEEQEKLLFSSTEALSIELARVLFKKGTRWQEVASLLRKLEKEDPEQIRWIVLGYAKSILLSGGPLAYRAYQVIRVFQDNWYDSKTAGLAVSCYEMIENTPKD